jgi:hypothetical protein
LFYSSIQALQYNNSVTVFSIGWNGVGSQGCQALADALRVNRTLHSIDLENTRLSKPDCTVLADGLLCNEVITAIRLDSNPLGDDTRLILRALERKTNPGQFIRCSCPLMKSPNFILNFFFSLARTIARSTVKKVLFHSTPPTPAATTGSTCRHPLTSRLPRSISERLSIREQQLWYLLPHIAQALAQAAAPSKGEAFRNESIDGVRILISGKFSPPSTGIFECDFVHLDSAAHRLSALSKAEFAEFNKQVTLEGLQHIFNHRKS